jgi:dienelactone hydrolase
MIRLFGRLLAARGIACFALDARDHGERKPTGTPAGPNGMRFAAVMRTTVGDYRLALDYLKTRQDVDSARVGLLGYSMGAMMGSVLGGVDQRVKALVLEVGGDPIRPFVLGLPPTQRDPAEFVSPSNYVGHIAPRPVLFINAKADQTIKEDAARRLQEAAREPKEIIWAEGGHILAPTDAQKGVAWLAEKLGASK